MHHIDFWFDPISPYAWLAFDALPRVLEGLSVEVAYRPVLFAGLLQHWGQKGPAEIGPKRTWTYRDVAWRAHRQGTPLELPAAHPFNPLPLLRLAVACGGPLGTPNRLVVEALFRHVWVGGEDAADPARIEALQRALQPARDPSDAAVKTQLRENTEHAVQLGLFGVPSCVVGEKAFWGADSLDALSACLRGDPWFDGPGWQAAALPRAAVKRN